MMLYQLKAGRVTSSVTVCFCYCDIPVTSTGHMLAVQAAAIMEATQRKRFGYVCGYDGVSHKMSIVRILAINIL